MIDTQTGEAPETKTAEAYGDVQDAFGEFMASFEAFKAANDRRLAEMETKFGADVVTEEKVDRISRALDEQKRTLDRLAPPKYGMHKTRMFCARSSIAAYKGTMFVC